MIKVKNHQTPPTMRPDRDLKARGKRCQKHRRQFQEAVRRAEGYPEPCQQSWQARLHPSPLSARRENSVSEILLCSSFLIVNKDLWGCCPSGVIKPYRHIFTLTFTHTHTRQQRHRYVSTCPPTHKHMETPCSMQLHIHHTFVPTYTNANACILLMHIFDHVQRCFQTAFSFRPRLPK